jgi:head-tail adaptor
MDDVLIINPGMLRDTVEFYTTTATQDDAGGFPTSTKTLAFSMLTSIKPKGSVRNYEGGKTEFIETWEVLMRYETDRIPTESYLVKYGDEWFQIKGIENVLRRNLVLKLVLVRK